MTNQSKEILAYATKIMRLKPKLNGTQFADKHYYLSEESSSAAGKWYTHPWQEEILNAMTDQKSHFVFFKKPTRVGFTKLITIATAYFIAMRPSVQLHYQPDNDEAWGFATDELETMIRDNEIVRDLISTPILTPTEKTTKKKETTLKKNYPGGYVECLGAESDKGFNRRTSRVTFADELDAWKIASKVAGNKVMAMFRRGSDFWDRKHILGGKPTKASYDPNADNFDGDGISQVDYWYKQGTMEHRYLPCPECDFLQVFNFEDLLWDKEIVDDKVVRHKTETAHFKCSECESKIFHSSLRSMDAKGKWIAHAEVPIRKKARSFYIWAMLSYSPNVTWTDISDEFLEAVGDKERLKNFYNEVLARPWDEETEQIDTKGMIDRKEDYESQVPKGVRVLTAGADVQKDRIECEVVGWGLNFESWSIEYIIFQGDTTQPEVWDRFRDFLMAKRWYNHDGLPVAIYSACVDAGYRTETVTNFTTPLHDRRVYAIMGANSVQAKFIPKKAGKTKTKDVFFSLGVNRGKDELSWHIKSKSGAGYMHFPNNPMYDHEYFNQLGAEAKDKTGRWMPRRKRNEVFDIRNYNLACLLLSGVDVELLDARDECLMVENIPKKKQAKEKKSYLDEF